MIVVTAFDQQTKPLVSVKQALPQDAAGSAVSLSHKARFIRVVDGAWQCIFPATYPISKARLAHIIEHHADVRFA